MRRYLLTEYEDASAETRIVYDDYLRTTGALSVPVWIKSLGHSATLARAYWERAKGTLFGGNLPLPLKEMIVFAVSASNGARNCSACHAQCVLNLDKTLTFEGLQRFLRQESDFQLPASYRDVVQFALKVTRDANQISDADFAELMNGGFGIREIGEIIVVIDMTTMFNVYTSSLHLELDPEYRAIL